MMATKATTTASQRLSAMPTVHSLLTVLIFTLNYPSYSRAFVVSSTPRTLLTQRRATDASRTRAKSRSSEVSAGSWGQRDGLLQQRLRRYTDRGRSGRKGSSRGSLPPLWSVDNDDSSSSGGGGRSGRELNNPIDPAMLVPEVPIAEIDSEGPDRRGIFGGKFVCLVDASLLRSGASAMVLQGRLCASRLRGGVL